MVESGGGNGGPRGSSVKEELVHIDKVEDMGKWYWWL